ncbi:MAG: YfhO family protein [Bacteroidaceae bacterium]
MKRYLPDTVAVLLFVLISVIYFIIPTSQGKIIYQQDAQAGVGASKEVKDYREKTGEVSRWTNSLFGGMPTYQITPTYASTDVLQEAYHVYDLMLPTYMAYLFTLLIGFFILLRAMGVSTWLSFMGSILWAFSSYFFILITAGHIWKMLTLAYIPPTIAGLWMVYKGKKLWGGIVTTTFLALQIRGNHIQMSYYFLFVMLFIAIAFFADAIQKKTLPSFFKSTGVLLLAGLLGVAINSSNLFHTYQYSKETIRGKKELAIATEKHQQKSNSKVTNANDEKISYITQWSYGIDETLTLLIPNFKGGSSVPISQNKDMLSKSKPQYRSIYNQIGQYFGNQPMTSGPVYVGAFVLTLFLLGCFILKGPMKWALIGATIFSIILAWGKNFLGPTAFFINYVPLYDSFRAVSSILVIAEFTIPLLAILTLVKITKNPECLTRKALFTSIGITGGISLLVWLIPALTGSFITTSEMNAFSKGLPKEMLPDFINDLTNIREYLVQSDAMRSLLIIILGGATLFAFSLKKLSGKTMVVILTIVCLGDLWFVDKRYLNNDTFVDASTKSEELKPTVADKYILNDKTLDYRVLLISGQAFNDNSTSYFHKNVGGYHAAKLQRYQDLIEHYLYTQMSVVSKEIKKNDENQILYTGQAKDINVINMLNTRYFIVPLSNGEKVSGFNPYSYGNAWYPKEIHLVDDAYQEMEALRLVSPELGIMTSQFAKSIDAKTTYPVDKDDKIELTSYLPNKLTYRTVRKEDGLAILAEIYYPGWEAFIDGNPVNIARANYMLRSVIVPKGEHTLTLRYDPKSVHITENIAFTGIGGLILLFLIAAGKEYYQNKHKNKSNL